MTPIPMMHFLDNFRTDTLRAPGTDPILLMHYPNFQDSKEAFSRLSIFVFSSIHIVWKSPKLSHLNFLNFVVSTNFYPFKIDLTQNVNVARFARYWMILFCYFQTPCRCIDFPPQLFSKSCASTSLKSWFSFVQNGNYLILLYRFLEENWRR